MSDNPHCQGVTIFASHAIVRIMQKSSLFLRERHVFSDPAEIVASRNVSS
jgi:hypothetical protein